MMTAHCGLHSICCWREGQTGQNKMLMMSAMVGNLYVVLIYTYIVKKPSFTLNLRIFSHKYFINNKTGNVGIKVTLRRVRITIASAENNFFNILSVCL
jgi:hypothetical protein